MRVTRETIETTEDLKPIQKCIVRDLSLKITGVDLNLDPCQDSPVYLKVEQVDCVVVEGKYKYLRYFDIENDPDPIRTCLLKIYDDHSKGLVLEPQSLSMAEAIRSSGLDPKKPTKIKP